MFPQQAIEEFSSVAQTPSWCAIKEVAFNPPGMVAVRVGVPVVDAPVTPRAFRKPLEPQHRTDPLSMRAQLTSPMAAIDRTD